MCSCVLLLDLTGFETWDFLIFQLSSAVAAAVSMCAGFCACGFFLVFFLKKAEVLFVR